MAGSSLSSQPRTLVQNTVQLLTARITAAGDYLLGGTEAVTPATGGSGRYCFPIRLDDLEVYNKQTRFRLLFQYATNNTSPAANGYVSLYAVSSLGGATSTVTTTLGAEVAGSRSATFALTGANFVSGQLTTPDFEIATSGLYVPVLHVDAAFATNSAAAFAFVFGAIAV